MSLADTSFVIALLYVRDALHRRAVAWASQFVEPPIVTEYVLLETMNAVSEHPYIRPKAHRLATAILGSPKDYEFIPASPELLAAGMELHRRRPDKEWSLTDCISFEVMKRRRIVRALTHDHHFEQAGFEALLRREPASSNGSHAP